MSQRRKKFDRDYVTPGDLRHRITLEKRSLETPAGDGVDFREEFSDLMECFAACETVAPKVQFGAVNIDEGVTHRFWIRYVKGIDTNVWVKHEGFRYPIQRVENKNSRNEYLVLHCNEKGAVEVEASKW